MLPVQLLQQRERLLECASAHVADVNEYAVDVHRATAARPSSLKPVSAGCGKSLS